MAHAGTPSFHLSFGAAFFKTLLWGRRREGEKRLHMRKWGALRRRVCILKRRKLHLLNLAAETTTTALRWRAEKFIIVTPLAVALLVKAGLLEEQKTSGVARTEDA